MGFSQNDKKTLQFDDILKWNRITEKVLSNDGNTIVYKNEPWKGDPVLKISSNKGKELMSVDCASGAKISFSSDFVIFTINPSVDLLRELKLKKTKKDDIPIGQLAIYNLKSGAVEKIDKLKSHKLPFKWGDWLAYQVEPIKGNTRDNDEDEKKETSENGYKLFVKNLKNDKQLNFPFVTQYYFAEEKEFLVYVSTGDDKDFAPGIYLYNLKNHKQSSILVGKGDIKQLNIYKDASKIAFLADLNDKKAKIKSYGLFYWNGEGQAIEVVNNKNNAIMDAWEISSNGRLSMSEKTNRIFFATSPIKAEKDTSILQEEIPVVDIWHWNEAVLQTQQINTKSRDLRKSYMAVYHADNQKVVQLETEDLNGFRSYLDGDSDFLFGASGLAYAVQSMWEGGGSHADIYLIDIKTGVAKMIKKDVRARPNVSPNGNYLYWYNSIDTTWNTYNIRSAKEFKITTAKIVQCANELNDVPNPPGSYGDAGWTEDDASFFIYDRYDLWEIDPENKVSPVNLTKNGRNTKVSFRLITLDREKEFIDINDIQYLSGHNEKTRADGYYTYSYKKKSFPEKILGGNYKLGAFTKAKDKDVVLYTKEDFETYPNIISSNLKFEEAIQISDANPQQKDFNWGTAELYSWTSLDGRKLEGTLHKPTNFDSDKKYPMIVNFYEKSSQGLLGYRMPECHRSTVDYHYYTSNGYLVFNPDVYYKEGYPGEDAFNCVMPGVTALIGEGFVDEDHIGAQGHSWGGYQVAYLATRTNLFAAIESGAPVVNMFSAYGGIRWGSGLNRSFQYEHTQSRIGKSIWESPLRYIENSPIFTMDKVTTPILIMHNDDDGAVPWYQGIEYFIALRRMGKKAWLLNYNDADHWPTKIRDKHDFQIRLAQFFDHYLKDAPMPKWMKEGIPAINKGIDMGYELVK